MAHPVGGAGSRASACTAASGRAAICGDWYVFADFGPLRLTIGYYIDSLTLAMFCMVSLVASCIHVYSIGYMHGELAEVSDLLAPLSDGRPCRRRGRYQRFFQCLSLFLLQHVGPGRGRQRGDGLYMLGTGGHLLLPLIGFWYERNSALNAANKAFIVNRVGDFGMIVGLMAIWGGSACSVRRLRDPRRRRKVVTECRGIVSQVRPRQRAQLRAATDDCEASRGRGRGRPCRESAKE